MSSGVSPRVAMTPTWVRPRGFKHSSSLENRPLSSCSTGISRIPLVLAAMKSRGFSSGAVTSPLTVMRWSFFEALRHGLGC